MLKSRLWFPGECGLKCEGLWV